MRRSNVLLIVAALAGTVAACGDSQDRFALRTPSERASAAPLPEVERASRRAGRDARVRPTRRDAERLRPVLRGWGDALRRDRSRRAARFFALPAIVARASVATLATAAQVRAFNDTLPCGARLLRVEEDGRFLVGTFELTRRPQHRCEASGDAMRIAFVLHDRKIAEWGEVPEGAAEPGPERPENAPDPPLQKVS